ncbi:MAG: 23S rRNA (adenine(2503)-C(2))-methyltransferase RlmN [Kiritimatiellae bacterium]|nr:23S rRNA (adenine(2503)-C(2))-methyltransferase RlmN [Kiritimatiellia bacterium]MDD5519344.1 23S rRNA (adenine(2503)-C(2))-methyltransferase RlmN [Kiritimatiellia bacterium]
METTGDTTTIAKTLIHSLSKEELAGLFIEFSEPKYRADQLWSWLYVKRALDWTVMTNLPATLKEKLARKLCLKSATAIRTEGETAGTRKILVGLQDGEQVEEVLIPGRDRRTVCVSSQAGCRFHCAFCASGQAGFRRNLEAGEMVGQVVLGANTYNDRPTNVVFMGIGEPFDNYDSVLKAVRIINDKDGLGIGARKITISTCGVIPGLERLAEEGIQVELSVSLHAPDDELRSKLMPVNSKYPLAQLMKACRKYFEKTGRIITFEYTLIKGLNDSASHARSLVRLMSGLPSRVNLIPLSPVEEFAGQASSPEKAEVFMEILGRAGINVTLRMSKGSSMKAACGQLRYRKKDNVT